MCNASGKPGVEKLPKNLHPEPCQKPIYGVLCTQNVTFQSFSLTPESLQKTPPEPPVGTLNAHVFHKYLEKYAPDKNRKKNWEIAPQKTDSFKKMTSKWHSKFKLNSTPEPKLSQRTPRLEKDVQSDPKSYQSDPRNTIICHQITLISGKIRLMWLACQGHLGCLDASIQRALCLPR